LDCAEREALRSWLANPNGALSEHKRETTFEERARWASARQEYPDGDW
jgi:hypothetical protein